MFPQATLINYTLYILECLLYHSNTKVQIQLNNTHIDGTVSAITDILEDWRSIRHRDNSINYISIPLINYLLLLCAFQKENIHGNYKIACLRAYLVPFKFQW